MRWRIAKAVVVVSIKGVSFEQAHELIYEGREYMTQPFQIYDL